MKFYLFLILLIILSSCEENNSIFYFVSKGPSKYSFRITKQITQYLDVNRTDTAFYYYQKENDFFPCLIEVKSSDNVITKQITLNEWTTPSSEQIFKNDSLVEQYFYEYSPKNYFLINKSKVIDSNVAYVESYHYDKDDYLRFVEIIHYSQNKYYINSDSNKITERYLYLVLPDTMTRYKGCIAPYLFLSEYAKYYEPKKLTSKRRQIKRQKDKVETGMLIERIHTILDERGFPKVQQIFKQDTLFKRVFFKVETDGLNNVRMLIPFKDSLYTQPDMEYFSITFSYGDDGIVNYISKNYYNYSKRKYINSDTSIYYSWFDFQENNLQNYLYIKATTKIISFSNQTKLNEVLEKRIAKFERDEIIEEYYNYPSNITKRNYLNLKPYKRVITLLEKIKLKTFKGL
ncbi:MAG: hypothetical protein N3A67_05200 [Ignavibacteria bacterium]|nr:hypothetical protein [Ignavibacteria bacterium]